MTVYPVSVFLILPDSINFNAFAVGVFSRDMFGVSFRVSVCVVCIVLILTTVLFKSF